jgi:hypothetical protein
VGAATAGPGNAGPGNAGPGNVGPGTAGPAKGGGTVTPSLTRWVERLGFAVIAQQMSKELPDTDK